MNELYKYPNVIGHGQTFDQKKAVLVSRKLPLAALAEHQVVPREFEGQRTDVLEVGDVRALLTRTDKWRPAPPGVSIGHHKITAGTFGCIVKDRETGRELILSNNHVLAASGDAEIGDPILQPGPADGGQDPQDLIGLLYRFEPIVFNQEPGECSISELIAKTLNKLAEVGGSSHRMETVKVQQETNLVDAAACLPNYPPDITEEILGIGISRGLIEDPPLGLAVTKSGRTTEVTEDLLIAKDVTISVSYGGGRTAVFSNQLMFGPMSAGGDSGSLIVAKMVSFPAVALLYAGSDKVTFGNPITLVLDTLEIELK